MYGGGGKQAGGICASYKFSGYLGETTKKQMVSGMKQE